MLWQSVYTFQIIRRIFGRTYKVMAGMIVKSAHRELR